MAKKEKKVNFKEMTVEELNGKIEKSKEDLFKLKFRAASAPLKNPMEIRNLKRDVARMKTFINQRRKQG